MDSSFVLDFCVEEQHVVSLCFGFFFFFFFHEIKGGTVS